jgi:hypothetical protein
MPQFSQQKRSRLSPGGILETTADAQFEQKRMPQFTTLHAFADSPAPMPVRRRVSTVSKVRANATEQTRIALRTRIA